VQSGTSDSHWERGIATLRAVRVDEARPLLERKQNRLLLGAIYKTERKHAMPSAG